MELCLTGRMLSADEALAWGLINHCVSHTQLRAKSLALAEKIASFSQPVVHMIKSLIKQASESFVAAGLTEERRCFQETFDLADQKEGFAAFLEHRPPQFKDC
jgi:enoyl-CoA hydratase